MIDTTQVRTVTKSGIDVMTSVENQFFAFGKILLLKKKDCVVLVSAGPLAGKKVLLPLTFPCTVDGVEYVADIPEVVVVDKAARVKAPAGETKIAKCKALFADHPELDKAAMIGLFMSEAACTKMGANTYYLTCKKG